MTRRRAKKAPRRTAVACLRVSTNGERQELGAAAQRQAIEVWAASENVEILGWYLDEVSGGAPLDEREGLLDALAAVANTKAQNLVFANIDRFSRDPATAALVEAELARTGARVVFADGSGNGDDPTAEMIRGIRLVVARFERKMIGRRIRAALAVKKSRLELVGKAPYGKRAVPGPERHGRVVMMLEPDEGEQATITRAQELAAQEGTTVRSIRDTLTAEGRLNRKGRPFGLEELHRMIRGEEAICAIGCSPWPHAFERVKFEPG